MTFPIVEVSGDDVKRARNGVRIQLPVEAPTGLVGVFTKEGEVISLSENKNSELIPLVVFQVDQ
jgi:hypothetical protein